MDRKYGVFFEITHIQSLLNRIFESFVEDRSEFSSLGGFSPDIDICESETELIITFEVAGVDIQSLNLTVSRNKITLSGNKERKRKGLTSYVCMERTFGGFKRSVPLTAPVNTHEADAKLHNGLLIVKMPKLKERRGHIVAIDIEEIE